MLMLGGLVAVCAGEGVIPGDPQARPSALPGAVTLHLNTSPLSELDVAFFYSLENMLEGTPFLTELQRAYDSTRQVSSVYIASLLGVPYAQTAEYVDASLAVQVMVCRPAKRGGARPWGVVLPVRRFQALQQLWAERTRNEGKTTPNPGQPDPETGHMANPYFAFEVLDTERTLAKVTLTDGAPWYLKDTVGRGVVMARTREDAELIARECNVLKAEPLRIGKGFPHVRCALDIRKIEATDPALLDSLSLGDVVSGNPTPGRDFPLAQTVFQVPATGLSALQKLTAGSDKAAFSVFFSNSGFVLHAEVHPREDTPLAALLAAKPVEKAPVALLDDLPASTSFAVGVSATEPTVRMALADLGHRLLVQPETGSGASTIVSRALDKVWSLAENGVVLALAASKDNDLNALLLVETENPDAEALAGNLTGALEGLGRAVWSDGRLLMLAVGPSRDALLKVYQAEFRKRGTRPDGAPRIARVVRESSDGSFFAVGAVDPLLLSRTLIGQVAMMMQMKGLPQPMVVPLKELEEKVVSARYLPTFRGELLSDRILFRLAVPASLPREMLDFLDLSATTLDMMHDRMRAYMLGEDGHGDEEELEIEFNFPQQALDFGDEAPAE